MRILTYDILYKLNGVPIRLSSPYTEGQLLSIDKEGKISLEDPDSPDHDQRWSLTLLEDGFEIVSAKYGFKICHKPYTGGIVSAVHQASPKNTKGCVWHLNEKGEIYTVQDEKKYLWLAGSHLYVTRDSFLAERWALSFSWEKLPSPAGPQYQKKLLIAGLVIVIAILYLNLS